LNRVAGVAAVEIDCANDGIVHQAELRTIVGVEQGTVTGAVDRKRVVAHVHGLRRGVGEDRQIRVVAGAIADDIVDEIHVRVGVHDDDVGKNCQRWHARVVAAQDNDILNSQVLSQCAEHRQGRRLVIGTRRAVLQREVADRQGGSRHITAVVDTEDGRDALTIQNRAVGTLVLKVAGIVVVVPAAGNAQVVRRGSVITEQLPASEIGSFHQADFVGEIGSGIRQCLAQFGLVAHTDWIASMTPSAGQAQRCEQQQGHATRLHLGFSDGRYIPSYAVGRTKPS
jgi:hypothetical protein